ncbi:hypothetical protein [Rhizobium ruizarguesonis]|uniref:hypothetical protein n=1 Tax=Rhizobium ruizarguesonis TaxID=2081791 RepID=UPI0013C23AFD|nr:hypothetical protein [Rhizobium ruizarguesonis]NEJ02558.1 hypothetical protein [Rhizobium ruizarguesonis]NEJ39686.1 hypothetical protein [Rhizobium ruizarguesonis]
MLRSILIAAVFAAAGTMPAYAASMAKCDDASITALQTKVDAMADQTKKTAATKQPPDGRESSNQRNGNIILNIRNHQNTDGNHANS